MLKLIELVYRLGKLVNTKKTSQQNEHEYAEMKKRSTQSASVNGTLGLQDNKMLL